MKGSHRVFTHPTELPSGLILAPDGELSGTPRSSGTFTFDVTAANLFGSATSTVRLAVGPTSGFDANGDGRPDLPVAAPGEDVGTVADAGAVSILFAGPDGRYGAAGGLRIEQEDVGQVSEPGDRFGAALALAEVTGDAFVDLVIGVPGEDAGAGQVVVVPGSSSGIVLSAAIVLGQGKDGAAGTAEVGDGFGSAVSVGDGLWVGAPGEDIGRAINAGAVTRFPIKPLKSTSTIEYRQGSAGVPAFPSRVTGSAPPWPTAELPSAYPARTSAGSPTPGPCVEVDPDDLSEHPRCAGCSRAWRPIRRNVGQ